MSDAEFFERQWERRHANGWIGIAKQTDEDMCIGYAIDPHGKRHNPETYHSHVGAMQDIVSRLLLREGPHKCSCGDWVEVPYRERD